MYIFNYYKYTLFIFLLIGSFAYVLAASLQIDERIINSIIILIIFINVFFIFYFKLKHTMNIEKNFIWLFYFYIVYMLMISIVLNKPFEYPPTFIRYSTYFLTFYLTYIFSQNNQISTKFILILITTYLIIGIIFGFIEMASGNVRFVNGAYRVSGHFNHHHLGYALYMYIPLVYYIFNIIFEKNLGNKFLYTILFTVGFYFFLESHSRALLLLLFSTSIGLYIVFATYGIKKMLMILLATFIFLSLFFLVMYSDFFPRIQALFTSGIADSSTMYRFYIIEETLKNMDLGNYLVGVGLGGFNMFFESATGDANVAAHNDYLLFFAEGGILGIVLYVIFQLYVITILVHKIYIIRLINYEMLKIGLTALTLFLSLEIFGFLLNVHYFYQSEILLTVIIGFFMGRSNYILMNKIKYGEYCS